MKTEIDDIVDSYLETALWSSADWDDMDDSNNPTPFDKHYSVEDFSELARKRAWDDCHEFVDLMKANTCNYNGDIVSLWEFAEHFAGIGQIGHDFWLTRNGHGAGFWDGDYDPYGDDITELVNQHFHECNLFADDDGTVQMEG